MPLIQVRDTRLYYEEHGAGRPVLLLHGLGSSGRDWEFQTPVWARRFRVLTLDARGHGYSDKPPGPYAVTQFAADTAAFLDQVVGGPAHIVGLSMGGMIAFQLGISRPDLTRSLVIVNSAPELRVRRRTARREMRQRRLAGRVFGMGAVGRVLGRRLLPGSEQAELRREFARRWAQNDQTAYLNSLDALLSWSVADQLGRITCPVLVVSADHDFIPLAVKEQYVARLPHARLVVIPNSRHATPVDQPQHFNQVVLDFLAAQA
jgi:pimeloyl-ACP methyl ester carboxylesterase